MWFGNHMNGPIVNRTRVSSLQTKYSTIGLWAHWYFNLFFFLILSEKDVYVKEQVMFLI